MISVVLTMTSLFSFWVNIPRGNGSLKNGLPRGELLSGLTTYPCSSDRPKSIVELPNL